MGFSALQRAEIAEILPVVKRYRRAALVSVLFNEPKLLKSNADQSVLVIVDEGFSALQRAEIAEIWRLRCGARRAAQVSVLFNEPKLLKSAQTPEPPGARPGFSALQRAEIAEI